MNHMPSRPALRQDITLLPEQTERRLRTLKDPQRLPRRKHIQPAVGPVICPFCYQDLDWDAAGAARVCGTRLAPDNKLPKVIEALCEKCAGYFAVRLIETGQLRVIPQDVPDWVESAEIAKLSREEKRRRAKEEAAERSEDATHGDKPPRASTRPEVCISPSVSHEPGSMRSCVPQIKWPLLFRP